MPSALETLVKILKLEQDTGYHDKAVIGGLNTFAVRWARDAHAQAKRPEHHALVDELAALIARYGELGAGDERHEAIKYMLGRITGRIPPTEGMVADAAPRPQAIEIIPPARTAQGDVDGYGVRPAMPTDQPREVNRERPQRPADRAGKQPYERTREQEQPERDNGRGTPQRAQSGENAHAADPERPARDWQERRVERVERPSERIARDFAAELPETPALASSEAAQPDGPQSDEMPPPTPRTYTPSLASGFERPEPAAPTASHERFSAARTAPDAAPKFRRNRRHHDPERRQHLLRALRSSVKSLDGVGPKNAEKLAQLGLYTIEDVLYNFPRRYDDYTQMLPLAKLQPGMMVTAVGEVRNAVVVKGKRGQEILNVTVGDGTGTLTASYFGMPYLRSSFERGMQIVLRGKVDLFLGKLTMTHPDWEPLERDALHMRQIVPVYSLTKEVKTGLMRRVSKAAVDSYVDDLPDYIPEAVLDRMKLPDLGWALRQMHFPEGFDTLGIAQRRLSFDELILLQLGVLQNRREWQATPALPICVDDGWFESFVASLPYPLTGAQARALLAIRDDIAKPVPMNRLLQGDVGAGKTVVAALAMGMAVAGGLQAAIMAPTGILAEQHYKGIMKLFQRAPGGGQVNIRLLTSATPPKERADTLWYLGEGKVDILVGTHALLQDDVNFHKLGVVVIDEQHRFGVEQRGKLRGKGVNPHVLVMTATPIPRTLALTMYADLDLTVLDEMPPGRSPIDTRILFPRERQRAYSFIDSQLHKGRQAFIVYPLVEASDTEAMAEVKSAVEEFDRLAKEVFPGRKLGLLHGKMTSVEKEAAMSAFSRGEIQVLVCTSVVEVGIDVPNASVMLIEGANRFGLAQLHQFRGRVGRGQHQSYCLLVPDDGDLENPRLRAMESTTDGFKLAELDWQMRGAGELLGTRQSGGGSQLGDHMDPKLVAEAQIEARTIFEEDPALTMPQHLPLREKLLARYAVRGEGSDVS
jgi:ATP-dependent DNA helicase RecG